MCKYNLNAISPAETDEQNRELTTTFDLSLATNVITVKKDEE